MTLPRRAFLGWTGLVGYGTWALVKPPRPTPQKPPKPTTTTSTTTSTTTTTTTTLPAGGGYVDVYADAY